jgi:hypothetical protein
MSAVPACGHATTAVPSRFLVPALVAACLACATTPAPAAPGWDVTAGLGGAYRAGSWVPLRLVPAPDVGLAAGDRVFVWAQDPDGRFVRAPAAPLEAGPDGVLAARVSVRVGRPAGRILVEHEPATAAAARAGAGDITLADPIPSTHRVLVVLGDLPSAGRAARLMTAPEAPPLTVVAPLERGTGAAGWSPRDYDMADMMIVCGRAVSSIPAAMLAGIDAWVRDGGRLVFCAGGSAGAVAAGGGPAATWLPGPIDRLVPLRRVAAIETHARTAGLAARPGASGVEVPLLGNRRMLPGTVDVFEGTGPADLPLVVRSAHGFGVITWVGLDVDDGPLRGWTGTDSLLVRLLGGRVDEGDGGAAAREPGAADLAGQLRTALERAGAGGTPPVAKVPFEAIAGLGLLYVLALYPLDWWIASRWRPWLAWFTLPALVTLFCFATWGIAQRRGPATDAPMRVAEIVDIDVVAARVRGHGWAAAWSAANAAFDLEVSGATTADAAVSWFADAGTGFGAIDAPMPHPTLAAADYAYGGSLAALDGVAVAAGSNRLFEASWQRPAPGQTPLVTSTLFRDGQGILRGDVAHHLPFALEDCRLAHGGWVYDVGRLPGGTTLDLRTSRGPRSLAGALQRRTTADDGDVPNRWRRDERDPLRILEIVGLHAAAGGTAYTLLPAGRLGRLDMSPLLAVDRAVLYGKVADRGKVADGFAAWTTPWRINREAGKPVAVEPVARLCRIVIPLKAAGAER